MTDTLGAQLSALIDDELPTRESGLLVRRLREDDELREQFATYALIGEAVRGGASAPTNLSDRIRQALQREAQHAVPQSGWRRMARPAGMAAVAASVALLAIGGLRTVTQVPGDPGGALVGTPSDSGSPVVSALVPQAVPVTLRQQTEGPEEVVPEAGGLEITNPSLYNMLIRHASVATGPQILLPSGTVVVASDRDMPEAEADPGKPVGSPVGSR